jgi:hypothetical protein
MEYLISDTDEQKLLTHIQTWLQYRGKVHNVQYFEHITIGCDCTSCMRISRFPQCTIKYEVDMYIIKCRAIFKKQHSLYGTIPFICKHINYTTYNLPHEELFNQSELLMEFIMSRGNVTIINNNVFMSRPYINEHWRYGFVGPTYTKKKEEIVLRYYNISADEPFYVYDYIEHKNSINFYLPFK